MVNRDMKTKFTYWQEDDGILLGYLNDYPDHWTQGKLSKTSRSIYATSMGPSPRISDARRFLR